MTTALQFGSTWRGFTIQVSASVTDKETKITKFGKKIKFQDFKVVLDTEKQAEEIKVLASRDDFDNGNPGPAHFWPLDCDAYNAYAKKNNLPVVNRTGQVDTILGRVQPAERKLMAEQQKTISELKSQLDALQAATPSSSKKGGK